MKKIECLSLNCCNEKNKCERCVPDWGRRYYVEIDDMKEGDERYTIFFPLMGFDEIMRNHIEHFKPMVTSDGFWYIAHPDARAMYAGSEKEEPIERTIKAITDHIENKGRSDNEEKDE